MKNTKEQDRRIKTDFKKKLETRGGGKTRKFYRHKMFKSKQQI